MSQLPFASIQNDFLRLDYLTTTAPRIIGLYANGVNGNLLAETPDAHWATPHGEFYLRGGHRLWTAPEDAFYTCPEDELFVTATDEVVTLKGSIDASGLEKEITIRLEKDCVQLSHKITWHGNETVEFSPWTITQMRLGAMAILPLSNVANGLQPNRNFVLWPYTKLDDERLELNDDLILLRGTKNNYACKVGNHNSHGWIACAMDDALFIKHFDPNIVGKYPDLDSNVESYVHDVCIELEALGPLKVLKKGDTLTHHETWQVLKGNYPTTLETARSICKEISSIYKK